MKSGILIIAMTSYAMTGDREKFLAAGMDAYIAKPVDKGALVEVIERVWGNRAAANASLRDVVTAPGASASLLSPASQRYQ